ncbi:hypothetical protein D3105_33655, partial [Streptomyces globisporus]
MVRNALDCHPSDPVRNRVAGVSGAIPTTGSRARECPTAAFRPPRRTAVRPALGPLGLRPHPA